MLTVSAGVGEISIGNIPHDTCGEAGYSRSLPYI